MSEIIIISAVAAVLIIFILYKLLKSEEVMDVNYDMSEGERYHHKWGYADTEFDFDGATSVKVSGKRYPISGYTMPLLVPFVGSVLGVEMSPDDKNIEKEMVIAKANINEDFMASIKTQFPENQFSIDDKERLIHSHGQLSVDEIYRILYGSPLKRFVDLVVYPQSEEDVEKIIRLAHQHNVCLIPYGGGTNVSGALACPVEEKRMIVSVDMRRMVRVLWVDIENNLACVEAGISGKQLEIALAEKGFTTGHDPDSVEISTLGGWISTNASGMKKNRYGNIEDIVLEATLVTPTGDIETKSVTPRNSMGVQPKYFLFGSEGNFGIITKAVLKIHPLPENRKYGALVFHSFEKGVEFLRELRSEGVLPASIRLVANNEFRLGQALKPKPTFWKAQKDKLQKFFLFSVLGFKLNNIVACTIVMEGRKDEIRQQEKSILRLAKKHKAVSAGASNGKRGYMLTFAIAYIRDFFNKYHVLGETFETSVPWSNIHLVTQGVEKELWAQRDKFKLKAKPFLSYRVTQTYHTGVCIYFTLGLYGKEMENPVAVFSEIENNLRKVILENGGSLSHHHGIGKIRKDFLPQVQSENSLRVLRETKKAMDPDNIFGVKNGAFN